MRDVLMLIFYWLVTFINFFGVVVGATAYQAGKQQGLYLMLWAGVFGYFALNKVYQISDVLNRQADEKEEDFY